MLRESEMQQQNITSRHGHGPCNLLLILQSSRLVQPDEVDAPGFMVYDGGLNRGSRWGNGLHAPV